MTRTRRFAAIVIFLAGINTVSPADHIPQVPRDQLDFQFRAGAMLRIGDWNPFLELRGRLEQEGNILGYRTFTLGSYYRPHKNLKVGAFYRLQQGSRHDDDWIDLNPGWS